MTRRAHQSSCSLWFGIQKRRFKANSGNLQGWLSAHVYLGTRSSDCNLHTGFQVGWNQTHAGLCADDGRIISSSMGSMPVLRVPGLMTENRAEDTLDSLILKDCRYRPRSAASAIQMPDNINQAVQESIKNTRIGGGLAQLSGSAAAPPIARWQ